MDHSHNDDAPIGRVMPRRRVLALFGTSAGAAVLAAYVPGALSRRARRRGSFGAVTAEAAEPCIVRPEQTEGPYFVDERLNRSDIRSDPSNGSVRQGVQLALTFVVQRIEGSSCVPLAGALVDLWHCDATGLYSDIQSEGTAGQMFLRGYQLTDADGGASFVTVYPGWYPGRTVHMHFKIRTGPDATTGYEFTSQLYFDDALTDVVYTQQPYAAEGARSTRNADDGIYQNGGNELLLTLSADGAGGYTSTFDVALEVTGTTTTTLAGGSCNTIAACLADLQSALPDPATATSRMVKRVSTRLRRVTARIATLLERAAANVARRARLYARARARLERLRTLAQAADTKGTLDVPLATIESAIDALLNQIPA